MRADWVSMQELPSADEVRRRYGLLRSAMDAKGYGTLVVPGRAGALEAGYLRYLSGWRLWFGDGYVVFPEQGDPTLVLAKRSQTYWARQQSWLDEVVFDERPAATVVERLRMARSDSVGFVGLDRIASPADVLLFRESLNQPVLPDATALLQELMLGKSDEEKRLQRVGVELVVAGLRRFAEVAKPGCSEREAVAQAIAVVVEGGCTCGPALVLTTSPDPLRACSKKQVTSGVA